MDVRELRVHRGDLDLFVAVVGDGPPVVLLHGLHGTHNDLGWLAIALADSFTLIGPDLRGRGESSPARDTEMHTFEEHASDVIAVLDRLELSDAALVGVSFGAAVAVATAVRFPGRVRALALLAPAFGALDDGMGEGGLDAYGALADRIEASSLREVAEQEAARTGSDRVLRRWLAHDEASVEAWFRAVPLYRPIACVADLREVRAPALVIPGHDDTHPPGLAERYAAELPNARLVDVGDDLRAMAEAVKAFLQAEGAGG